MAKRSPPLFDILTPVNAVRPDGESSFYTAERELLKHALWKHDGDFDVAAAETRVSSEEFADKCRRHGLHSQAKLRVVS